jgi:ribosomal protein S2
MPKLELGNLDAVEEAKNANIPVLAQLVTKAGTSLPRCRPVR